MENNTKKENEACAVDDADAITSEKGNMDMYSAHPPPYHPTAPPEPPPPYTELPTGQEQSLTFYGIPHPNQYGTEEPPETVHSLQLAELLDWQRRTASMTDVTLVCGGREFPAHKMILCAASDYFRTKFATEWNPSGTSKLELPSVTACEMEVILPFLYTGKLQELEDPSLMKTLLQTSHELLISSLFECCYKSLLQGLTSKNFLEMYTLANYYNNESMEAHVLTFLSQNFTTIATSEQFLKLNTDQIQKIVQHPDIHYYSPMDEVIKGLLQWTDVEEGRENELLRILAIVNLQNLSTEFLTELLREHPLVKKNYHLLTLLTAEATARVLLSSSTNLENKNEPKLLCFSKNNQRQTFRMYDVKQNRWSLPKTLPFQLEVGTMPVWFGGCVYLLGGGELTNTGPSSKIVKYNPVNNTVASFGKLQTPVRQAGVAVLFEAIYVVNGLNEKAQSVTTVQRYNPVTGTSTLVANTNNSHNMPHVIPSSNYLYALGSYKEQNSVERYDSQKDEWTIITAIPGAIEWCRAAILKEKLYVIPTRKTNEFQIYDFASSTWTKTEIGGTPKQVFGLFPSTLDGKCILLVRDGQGSLNVYDTEGDRWVRKSESNKEPWSYWQICNI